MPQKSVGMHGRADGAVKPQAMEIFDDMETRKGGERGRRRGKVNTEGKIGERENTSPSSPSTQANCVLREQQLDKGGAWGKRDRDPSCSEASEPCSPGRDRSTAPMGARDRLTSPCAYGSLGLQNGCKQRRTNKRGQPKISQTPLQSNPRRQREKQSQTLTFPYPMFTLTFTP